MRAVLALSLTAILLAAPALAAEKKGPPSCAAIDFRPVPQGMPDGEMEAGMYKSRFGRIEVKATIKGGEARDYVAVVNGKPLKAVAQAPKSAESCAAAKKVGAPGKAIDACEGSKIRVVIDSTGKDKVLMLYGLKGKAWTFCRAGTPA
jgi:hypothetical protein